MNLSRKNLLFTFFITLGLQLIAPSLFPQLKLKFFVPFLILAYYQRDLLGSLRYSFFCGLLIDLLSGPTKFGLYALTYTLTTALLYSQRLNLFADNAMTLPIMTFLFSLVSTVLEVCLLYIFGKPTPLSFHWFFSELLIMPLADTLYSFLVFILPFYLFGRRSGYSR